MDATLNAESRTQHQEDPWTLRESGWQEDKMHDRDFNPAAPYHGVEEPDIEFEFAASNFPVTEGQFVKVLNPNTNPVRILYKVKEEVFEVEGWGLTVPLEDFPKLPKEIGRRFLQLYCSSQDGTLSRDDEDALALVSQQIDYRGFAASRLIPRRLEATLVRTEPVAFLEFLDDKREKLPRELTEKLEVLKPGDRFAAYFQLNGDGKVLDIRHVDLLPRLETVDPETVFDSFKG
ncbi:MAG: hypothetical protein WD708_11350 [Kiritimatiellia bacterium]